MPFQGPFARNRAFMYKNIRKRLKERFFESQKVQLKRKLILGSSAFVLWPFVTVMVIGWGNLAIPFYSRELFLLFLLVWVWLQAVLLTYFYLATSASMFIVSCFQGLLALSNGFLFILLFNSFSG